MSNDLTWNEVPEGRQAMVFTSDEFGRKLSTVIMMELRPGCDYVKVGVIREGQEIPTFFLRKSELEFILQEYSKPAPAYTGPRVL